MSAGPTPPSRSCPGPGAAVASLADLLACPRCTGSVEIRDRVIVCRRCHIDFPQHREDVVDLLLPSAGYESWRVRLDDMERWYRDLVERPEAAVGCFEHDYTPYARLLGLLRGTILDVGGGIGLVRHYLHADARYVVLEPSLQWLGADWRALARRFPCLNEPPRFVRGVGEYLPFGSMAFDHVLMLWALNHACDPGRAVRECARVLKPSGDLLIVLEDMPPTWRDLCTPSFWRTRRTGRRALVTEKIRTTLFKTRWPVQSDHVPIDEPALRAWAQPHLACVRRQWIGGYLSYTFRKPNRPSDTEVSR